jgi:hypothetical protein
MAGFDININGVPVECRHIYHYILSVYNENGISFRQPKFEILLIIIILSIDNVILILNLIIMTGGKGAKKKRHDKESSH